MINSVKLKAFLEKNLPGFIFNFSTQLFYSLNGLNFFRISRIKKILEQKPAILAVETISVCNAKCIFCAYPTMKREHEVMPLNTFEKIISEYSSAGGGALSLTPVMGDPLLDPHLIERYKIIERFENINQISFTTNGIAFHKLSDEDVKYILSRTFIIQFSIGGLDKEIYKSLYQVDKLKEVLNAVKRILNLKKEINSQTHITLAFRTNNPNFEKDYAKELQEWKDKGTVVSHMCTYNNYGGEIEGKNIKIKADWVPSKKMTCALPLLHAHMYSNGKITNCGCVDANGDGLIIGDSKYSTFKETWHGQKRQGILDSFPKGKLSPLCQKCNAYRPFTYLGSSIFKKLKADQKLPLEFYINFFGG